MKTNGFQAFLARIPRSKLTGNSMINSDKITIDPENWTSNSNMETGNICFGAKQMPESVSEELIFEDWNFKEEKQFVYRFNHEMSHFVISNY